MLSIQASRRSLLKGVLAGASVGAAGIAGISIVPSLRARAVSPTEVEQKPTSVQEILHITRTMERLAVTLYSHGLAQAATLGLQDNEITCLQAALVEEQIHEYFLRDNGAQPLTSEFSFPHGPHTFTSLAHFIETQQELEDIFAAAYLAAVREFALQRQSRLAQIAAQMATIESEHRVLGRAILGQEPPDNWAFTPVLLASVADVPHLLTQAGYLTPVKGNDYLFMPASTSYPDVIYRAPDIVGS